MQRRRRVGALSRVAAVVTGDWRIAAAWCVVGAAVAYGIGSIAWPVVPGRDGANYLIYYRDMWNSDPSLPLLMLYRTPLAPLLMGVPLQLGGPVLLEIVFGVAYAASVAAYALAAGSYRRWFGAAVAAALLVYPPFNALFHRPSSDAVFAFVLALWTLAAVRTAMRPSIVRYAALGSAVIALVLARPTGQLYLVFAVVPLLLPGTWRVRVARAAAFAVAAVALLAGWSTYNYARYGDFTVSRSANILVYRAFVVDKIVAPENGPASRELAAAVRRDLLPYYRPPMTVSQFFSIGGDRMMGDLVVLSDRDWGWSSNYAILRRVALEAIRRHPGGYAHSVFDATRVEFTSTDVEPAPLHAAAVAPPAVGPLPHGKPLVRRPVPTRPVAKQPPDPGGVLWWLASTPDQRITKLQNGALVWPTPGQTRKAQRLFASAARLGSGMPNRDGSARGATVLNDVGRVFPRMVLWLLLGVLALIARRPRGWLVPTVLAVVGAGAVVATVLGMPPGLDYRLPFDPIFIAFGIGGLLLPRRGSLPR